MVRLSKIVIVFAASVLILTGCNSAPQNFLGVDNSIASNDENKAYSIENNQGIVHYKDNGVYDSTGLGYSFHDMDIEDIDFELNYPQDPIGY